MLIERSLNQQINGFSSGFTDRLLLKIKRKLARFLLRHHAGNSRSKGHLRSIDHTPYGFSN
jgi:hypothetical protein